ncbi:MAG: hypothetical protein CVT96_05315 [Bacteroidetes bacterium HGW-Bacteroidetes-13]|nr:MAG: hypothetical protein CVT96_05315 [Bacteroidetes bacterium HGW-Bacteroidetes-13]
MVTDKKEPLFELIKSLSKSEKRQFKLYVGRLGGNTDAKFMLLFNFLDKSAKYDEPAILKAKIVKKEQISNLKAHLYRQVLVSLRLNPQHQNLRAHLREQLDFATILYHKGLYNQSLKVLDKAKEQAKEFDENNIAYEIVELEKVIESQYITRSLITRADELSVESKELSVKNVIASKLSNISLQLYSLLLKSGYVRNNDDYQRVTKYFNDRLPQFEYKDLGFREKLFLYKAYLWYSFLIQDFVSCFKYSRKWVDLFLERQDMISLNPVFFIKGNNYLLESLFYLRRHKMFEEALEQFEHFINIKKTIIDENTTTLAYLYLYNNKINARFLSGEFKEGVTEVPDILRMLKEFSGKVDPHHVMLFYYKIACLYFGAGDYKNCIVYLQKIIQSKDLSMREDLMCFARVLNLVAHYEAGLDFNLESQIRSTYRFLIQMNDLHEVQKEMIKFLRSLGNMYPSELKNAFIKLYENLKKYETHPYESRAFLYLDILSWLESRIENKPVDEVIKSKLKR